jgi:sec-independent protein translocase protein TatA
MGITSGAHWFIVGAVALLLFGNRLPEVARSFGRAVSEFKKGLNEIKRDLEDATTDEPRPRIREPKE